MTATLDYRGLPQGVHTSTALEHVIFGQRATDSVVREVEAMGKRRVFLTTSNSLSGPQGLPAQIATALGDRYAGTFSDIQPHVPRHAVLAGAAAARAAHADLLVSIGGGSVSDATKHMLLCLWENITAEDELDRLLAELAAIPDPSRLPADAGDRIRMLAVPTLFSAGEFTWFAGVTDTGRQVKDVAFNTLFSPRAVILDPAATLATPIPLLRSTGMKAAEHSVEFLCAWTLPPLVEAVAGTAWRLLHDGLPRLGGPDDDLKLRMDCQFGSWYSIYCIVTGVPAGASHAIGHVLGPLGVPHGHTSGVILPAIQRWNACVNAEQQAKAAALVGKPTRALSDVIADLADSLSLPTRLRDLGLRRDQFDDIADKSMADALIGMNPRPITCRDDVLEILELAW